METLQALTSTIEAIAERAVSLFAARPVGAGLTLEFGAGEEELVTASIAPGELGPYLVRAGLVQKPQLRSEYDLCFYLDWQDGKFFGQLERITGMAQVPAYPDPIEVLGTFCVSRLAEAKDAFCHLVSRHVPERLAVKAKRLFYRKTGFARSAFHKDRVVARKTILGRIFWGQATDHEMEYFIKKAINDSARLIVIGREPLSIQLWYDCKGVKSAVVSTTTKFEGDKFTLQLKDHRRSASLRYSGKTLDSVAEKAATYMQRHYAFQFGGISITFFWNDGL
jgi:hypothetical protein